MDTHAVDPTGARAASITRAAMVGGVGIGALSVFIFSTVAFAERAMIQALTLGGAYAVWALLFMVGGGAILTMALAPGHPRAKFVVTFAVGFLLYSAAYVAFYFTMKSVAGEAIGIGVGSVLLAVSLAVYFKRWDLLILTIGILLATNLSGYFSGRVVWRTVPAPSGMILWGLLYGTDLGLGLGLCMHFMQRRSVLSR